LYTKFFYDATVTRGHKKWFSPPPAGSWPPQFWRGLHTCNPLNDFKSVLKIKEHFFT
jgi:hypothetical protein